MYDSLTGNVARFIKKLPVSATQITADMQMSEAFILMTYTTGLGKIPEVTTLFLKTNHHLLRGVAASGNRNFGTYFAVSADQISKYYQVPILLKFELSGTPTDVLNFMEGLSKIEAH